MTPWVGKGGKPTAAAWHHAAHFAVNDEIQPGHNVPAPVKTEALVGYTKTALWLRFVARDPHPADIRIKYREHDNFANNDEYVGIIFNPFNDTQFGYEFFCTVGGVELDAFRQQNNEYDSYDTIWYCDAHLTRDGYVVTMEIPLTSLKFPHSDRSQSWRILFFRSWARKVRPQIVAVKFRYTTNSSLCQAELVRPATPIPAQNRNFQIIPVLGGNGRCRPHEFGLAQGAVVVVIEQLHLVPGRTRADGNAH